MGRVNASRVVLGGLLAGVVINVLDAASQLLPVDTISWITDLGLPEPGGGAMATWLVLGFVVGVAAVWLYAAIRPRYGAGPRTALLAGGAVWLLALAVPLVGFRAAGIVPGTVFWVWMAVGLVEMLAGTLAGARVYREEAPASATTG